MRISFSTTFLGFTVGSVVFVLFSIKCGVSVFCKASHSLLFTFTHSIPTSFEARVSLCVTMNHTPNVFDLFIHLSVLEAVTAVSRVILACSDFGWTLLLTARH